MQNGGQVFGLSAVCEYSVVREFDTAPKGKTAVLHLQICISKSRRLGSKKPRLYRGFRGTYLFYVPFMVEVMGIEPMSENPLTQLSSWAVCFLFFPFGDASRHAFPHGSTFFPDRFRRDRRCRFTAHLTLSPKPRYSWEERVTRRSRHCLNFTLSRKTQAAIATVLLSFIICFGQFSSLPGSPRLSCLRIPVETFTPPCFHSLTGSPDPIPLYTLFSALSREICQEKSAGK